MIKWYFVSVSMQLLWDVATVCLEWSTATKAICSAIPPSEPSPHLSRPLCMYSLVLPELNTSSLAVKYSFLDFPIPWQINFLAMLSLLVDSIAENWKPFARQSWCPGVEPSKLLLQIIWGSSAMCWVCSPRTADCTPPPPPPPPSPPPPDIPPPATPPPAAAAA